MNPERKSGRNVFIFLIKKINLKFKVYSLIFLSKLKLTTLVHLLIVRLVTITKQGNTGKY